MTYLELLRYMHPELFHGYRYDAVCVIRKFCPAQFFGKPGSPCMKVEADEFGRMIIAGENEQKCLDCWNQEYRQDRIAGDYCEKREDSSLPFLMEELMGNMAKESYQKQMLAIRIANEILQSEAFMEYYPITRSQGKIENVLTQFLRRNKVSTEDGRRIFKGLSERYLEMQSHSDRSVGPSKLDLSQSSQPE